MSGFDYFTSQGWSPVQSAGIMGNLFGESGLNPGASGDGGAAYGIAQWHPDRQATFQRVMGVNIRSSSIDQQYAFVNWELNNTEKSAGNFLRSQTSLSGATYAFMNKYERPADNSSFSSRLKAAGSSLAKGSGLLASGARMIGMDGVADKLDGLAGSAIEVGANFVPGGSMIVDALGMGADGCGWICQLQNWIKESGFFQRLALAFLAFIVLIAAFYMMKGTSITEAMEGTVNG